MKIDRLLLAMASLAAAVVALAGGPTSARAQVYVIESSVPDIKVGAQLAMADSLSIPAGAAIRAVLPSGKTQTVKGPYSGPVADLITMSFPILLTGIGLAGAYGIYTLAALLSVFFVLRYVHETKGKELEQMEG